MADNAEKDQKTEEATPRRLEEARDKGQVGLSSELVAGLSLVSGALALVLGGPALARVIGHAIVRTLEHVPSMALEDVDVPLSAGLLRSVFAPVWGPLAVVVFPTIVLGAVASYAQVGLRITPKAVELDPNKINPIKGFGRLFGMRSIVRTAMALAKVLAVAIVVGAVAWHEVRNVIRLGINELGPQLVALGWIAMRCTAAALVVVVLLSLIDLLFQRYQHKRDLRMTKQEVKEEHKLTDGDPHVRARVRQLQREMASRRMMADVPTATVVVTNPTHYAVALKYERDGEGKGVQDVPIVVAKGLDHVAQKIKEVARENDVVCYEDVPLARALYRQVEVGQEIPEDLYAAVAAVLSYVFRLEGRTSAPARPVAV